MTMRTAPPRLVLALALFAVAGCNSGPAGAKFSSTAVTPTAAVAAGAQAPAGAPVVPTGASGGIDPAAAPAQPETMMGLVGTAMLPSGAFAGAPIKVYRPGQATPIATGVTGADGSFAIDLGTQVPNGALLKLVAGVNGNSLAGIAPAGLVAAGGGNLVAAGGGNLVAAGGGNLVAAGGGNLVAAGGGNYQLLAATKGKASLTAGSTLALAALGKRLEGACGAAYDKKNGMVEAAIDQVMDAYAQMTKVSDETLTRDDAKDLLAAVLASVDASGHAELPADAADKLANLSESLREAFVTAANALAEAMETAVLGGGTVSEGTEAIQFGDESADSVDLPDAPETPETPDTGGSTGGGSSGGSGGGDGSDGAEEDDEADTSNGEVNIHGQFDLPTYAGG